MSRDEMDDWSEYKKSGKKKKTKHNKERDWKSERRKNYNDDSDYGERDDHRKTRDR